MPKSLTLLAAVLLGTCTRTESEPARPAVATPPSVREALCEGRREPMMDAICDFGRPVRALTLDCSPRRYAACAMSPPAHAHYVCQYPSEEATPPVTRAYSLPWTSGDLLALPPLAEQPNALVSASSRRQKLAREAAPAAYEALDRSLKAAGCVAGVGSPREFVSTQYFRCDDFEVEISMTDDTSTTRLVTLTAGSASYFDCESTGRHGRIVPR